MTDDFYRDPEVCQAIIMDYYRNPRSAGTCEVVSRSSEGTNPACGDQVFLTFHVDAGGRLVEARARGAGCAISQASASLLVEQLQGKTLEEAEHIIRACETMMSDSGDQPEEVLHQLMALRVIRGNPARVRCAEVSWKAARRALWGDT